METKNQHTIYLTYIYNNKKKKTIEKLYIYILMKINNKNENKNKIKIKLKVKYTYFFQKDWYSICLLVFFLPIFFDK